MKMIKYTGVSGNEFRRMVGIAVHTTPQIALNVDIPQIGSSSFYFLASDGLSGYAINYDGELSCVWSLLRGRGDGIVAHAVDNGAFKLNCFDVNPLVSLYSKHGFRVARSEPNWAEGEPDIVYMILQGYYMK